MNESTPGDTATPTGTAVVDVMNLADERVDEDTATTGTKKVSRESTRSNIAYTLLAILVLTSAGWVVVGIFAPESQANGAFDKIFTGILGLAGTVVGFYFGSASQEGKG